MILMIKKLEWAYKKAKRAYNYVVHVPHAETDWKLAIVLSIAMLGAIGTHF